jgi:hypothetical protein
MDDFDLIFTDAIIVKLNIKHNVQIIEVEESFFNWIGRPIVDNREQHRTKPPTIWFISSTSEGRLLKIIGIPFVDQKEFVIKSAFEPDEKEIEIYEKNQ